VVFPILVVLAVLGLRVRRSSVSPGVRAVVLVAIGAGLGLACAPEEGAPLAAAAQVAAAEPAPAEDAADREPVAASEPPIEKQTVPGAEADVPVAAAAAAGLAEEIPASANVPAE
jgi:hypothetical protein